MDDLELFWKYGIPVLIAFFSGGGTGWLTRQKKIKKLIDERCGECSYKQIALTEEHVARRMSVAKGYLDLIWRDMKIEYAELVSKEYKIDIISDKKCDESKSFFLATYETKIPLMEKYENEFRRNGIELWEDHDVQSRAKRMFAFIAEEFEDNFRPKKKELSKKVVLGLNEKKDKYIMKLVELYNSARHVED